MSSAQVQPRTNLFAEQSYLRTNVSQGVIHTRYGTRICVLTSDFLLGFRRAIEHECGEASDEVLKHCGIRWGTQFGKRLSAELEQHYGMTVEEFSVGTLFACLGEAFSHHGLGRLSLDASSYAQGLISATLDGAVYAELLGKSERPADNLVAGMLAGLLSVMCGEELDCLQTQCVACGGSTSRFVIGLAKRLQRAVPLVDQGKPHDEVFEYLAETRTS